MLDAQRERDEAERKYADLEELIEKQHTELEELRIIAAGAEAADRARTLLQRKLEDTEAAAEKQSKETSALLATADGTHFPQLVFGRVQR